MIDVGKLSPYNERDLSGVPRAEKYPLNLKQLILTQGDNALNRPRDRYKIKRGVLL